jgi:hypothetical protein
MCYALNTQYAVLTGTCLQVISNYLFKVNRLIYRVEMNLEYIQFTHKQMHYLLNLEKFKIYIKILSTSSLMMVVDRNT